MENGPRYDHAAQAAATILNLYWGLDAPKHEIFAKILYCILAAMYEADGDIAECMLTPSEN